MQSYNALFALSLFSAMVMMTSAQFSGYPEARAISRKDFIARKAVSEGRRRINPYDLEDTPFKSNKMAEAFGTYGASPDDVDAFGEDDADLSYVPELDYDDQDESDDDSVLSSSPSYSSVAEMIDMIKRAVFFRQEAEREKEAAFDEIKPTGVYSLEDEDKTGRLKLMRILREDTEKRQAIIENMEARRAERRRRLMQTLHFPSRVLGKVLRRMPKTDGYYPDPSTGYMSPDAMYAFDAPSSSNY